MIRGSEISVIVQGPVASVTGTRARVAKLRELLPGCEILLSNQMPADQDACDADRVVTTPDPGAVPHGEGWVANNVNRQLVSVRAGLQAASRRYAIKLRSDQMLEHTGFLQWFGRYERSSGCLFEHPVVASTIYSVNPRRWMPLPFHPGDMFHFGLRTDLLNLWAAPLAPEPDTTRWFESRPRPDDLPLPWSNMRFAPEQWIWIEFLRQHRTVACEDAFDLTGGNLEFSEWSIACNLIMAEPASLGLNLGDRHPYPALLPGCYTEGEWRSLYSRYVRSRWRPAWDGVSLRRKWTSRRVVCSAWIAHRWGRLRMRFGALRHDRVPSTPPNPSAS